jgi:hypothetical protein
VDHLAAAEKTDPVGETLFHRGGGALLAAGDEAPEEKSSAQQPPGVQLDKHSRQWATKALGSRELTLPKEVTIFRG